jgi:hypothetical protein
MLRFGGAVTRGCLLAAGMAIATWITCSGVAAGSAGLARCFPAHSQTIAKNQYVRVYSFRETISRGYAGTYACLLRRGSTVALATPRRYHPGSVDHVTLAHTIVAYTLSTHSVDTGSTDIIVVNVANGRTLRTVRGVGGFIDACVISFSDVTDLVVTSRGSIAWIVRKGARCKTSAFEVYSERDGGAPILLEEAPAIAPESLSFSHQTVSWETAGQRKSAPLA